MKDKDFIDYMERQLSQVRGRKAVNIVTDEYGYVGLEFDNGLIVWFLSDDEGNDPGYTEVTKVEE